MNIDEVLPESPSGDAGAPVPRAAIKAGDYAIITDRYGSFVMVGPIAKVTPETITHPDRWGGSRTKRTGKDAVRFWGSEDVTKLLGERLNSSLALMKREHAEARVRHFKRVEAAIAKADAQ